MPETHSPSSAALSVTSTGVRYQPPAPSGAGALCELTGAARSIAESGVKRR